MAKTTTIHLRWLRFKRHVRLSGPRAAQRRATPWMALPIFNRGHRGLACDRQRGAEGYR